MNEQKGENKTRKFSHRWRKDVEIRAKQDEMKKRENAREMGSER